jgi:hypothetical protein
MCSRQLLFVTTGHCNAVKVWGTEWTAKKTKNDYTLFEVALLLLLVTKHPSHLITQQAVAPSIIDMALFLVTAHTLVNAQCANARTKKLNFTLNVFSLLLSHMSLMDFVDSHSGCDRNVTDVWGWDAHEAQLRCSDEVDGDIWIWSTRRGLKPKFY